MEHLLHEKRHQAHLRWLQRYQRLTYVLAAVVFLLLLMLYKLIGHERTVLLPLEVDAPFWVSQTRVADNYLQEMTRSFAWLLLNTTPAIVKQQQASLLRHVHPQSYNKIKAQLDKDAKRIKRENISSAFYPTAQDIDTQKLQVILHGELHVRAGLGEVIKKRQRYLVQYAYQQGRLWLTGFNLSED